MIYIINNYFEFIDSEDKAYWLGFIYADGCVTKDHKQLIINLAPKDYNHLEKFKQCIQGKYQIRFKDNNRYVSYCVSCKQFIEYLINDGCIPHKSLILQFPNTNILPIEYRRHFIRGYFDGDGCFSAIIRKRKKQTKSYI